jgi:membrane protein
MSVVYKWIPNTHVRFRAAIVGALVATILLEGGKAFLGAYIGNAFSVRYLYGSLGLIPLFMFWVYAMWLIVLFGVEVAAALQKFTGGVVEEESEAKSALRITEPGAIVAVMEIVAERFTEGEPTSARDIADALGIEERTVGVMLDALVDARLLHRVEHEESAFALAVPLESLGVDRLLDVGFGLTDELPTGRLPLLDELRAVQRELAKKKTLAALVVPVAER